MRLTTALFYYVNRRKIPGKITIGKYRKHVPISPEMKYNAAQDLVREQENMEILSRPYLTEEQNTVWANLQLEKEKAHKVAEAQQRRADNMPKHYTFQEHLAHLNVNKNWHQ